jgi:hypothetical protein
MITLFVVARNVALIMIGGWIGLVSWAVWAGASVAAYWYAGATIAVTTSIVMGKVVTPTWVVGMTREANRRWPAFARFIAHAGKWWRVYYRTVIVVAMWSVLLGLLVLWLR